MIISYSEIDVGDELPLMKWTPNANMVKVLMNLSGWMDESETTLSPMSGPNRFTDLASAQKEGFAKLIVPGNYGMMAMASAVEKWIPKSFMSKLDCVFRQPLIQDVEVQIGGVVTDRQVEDGEITLELDLYIVRDDGQRPQGGTAIVRISK